MLPDLTIMGKIIGGGLPAAAYGGPRELMERIAPAGDVYQAGTLSGNPLAVAAALATLRRSTPRPTSGSRRPPSGSPTACARRREARVPGPGAERARPVDDLLLRAPGVQLRRRRRVRPDAFGALVPGAARARRISAAVAVRGMVPVAGPRRARHRAARSRRPPRRSRRSPGR